MTTPPPPPPPPSRGRSSRRVVVDRPGPPAGFKVVAAFFGWLALSTLALFAVVIVVVIAFLGRGGW